GVAGGSGRCPLSLHDALPIYVVRSGAASAHWPEPVEAPARQSVRQARAVRLVRVVPARWCRRRPTAQPAPSRHPLPPGRSAWPPAPVPFHLYPAWPSSILSAQTIWVARLIGRQGWKSVIGDDFRLLLSQYGL